MFLNVYSENRCLLWWLGIQVDPGTSQFRRLWATSIERMMRTNMTRPDLSHSCRLEDRGQIQLRKAPPHRHPRNLAHIPRARSGPRNVRYGSLADLTPATPTWSAFVPEADIKSVHAHRVPCGPGAHYIEGYEDVSGIMFPTKRRIFPRQADGTASPEPLVVSIDLSDITLK